MSAKELTDLIVWEKAHRLVLTVYAIVSKLPKQELYGLTSQIKRAVVSVTSNIAEGFVRHSVNQLKRKYNSISLLSVH